MNDRVDPALIRLAAVLMVGGIASLLNTTIVGVSLDTIGTDLRASVAEVQWAASGYLLALAVVVPTMAFLVDRIGGRRLWRISLVLFTVSSLLCGAAWSATSLIVFRVLQGFGGGLILPLLQTILATAAGPNRLGRVMALVAVPGQLAPLLGPILGGMLIDGPGWRWVFWISVPLCVLALVLSWRKLPEVVPATDRQPLDLGGLALLCPGLALLLYGSTRLTASAGVLAAGLPVGAGLVLLCWYVLHTRRRTVPLVDLKLFRFRSFGLASALMLLAGASIFGPMVLLPVFYQQVHGASGMETGLLLAPLAIGTMAALPTAGKLTDRLGPRPLLVTGMAIASIGTVPFVVAPTADHVLLGTALFIRGLGLGLATVPITAAAYSQLPAELIPQGTTLISIVQRIGGSFGTALLLTLLHSRIASGSSVEQAHGFTLACTLGLSLIALIPAAFMPRPATAESTPNARN